MGNTSYTAAERREIEQEELLAAAEKAAEVKSQRLALSKKIAMVVVDKIVAEIVRPGPKPEERECYVMAQELRTFSPEIAEIIAAVLVAESIAP